MSHKITTLLMALAVLLSACAQTVSVTPSQPVKVPEPTAYPAPAELAPLPTASDTVYPYPYPLGNSPLLGDKNTVELKSGINADFAPQAGDVTLVTGPAYVETASSEVLMRTGEQPTALHLVGNVPNPCYEVRVVVQPPDAQNKLMVEVYSVADAERICVEMLQPFDVTVALGTLAAGTYTVFINEQELGPLEVK
jgi:hypothetical protein